MATTEFHHGLEIHNGSPKFLRFGCLRLMHLMSQVSLDGLPRWTKRWRSRHFSQNTAKFQELFWKFNRVSEHVGRCERSIRRWEVERANSQDGSRLDDPDLVAQREAVSDLPIFLDSQLVYLRIQMDVFTTFVTYLSERHSGARSFRQLRNWHVVKRPNADEAFSRLLERETDWFDLLSGKSPKGLREIVVHDRGTYQLGWMRGLDGSFQLMPNIVNDAGIASDNVAEAVGAVTQGFFRFLDSAFVHFETRLREIGVSPELLRNDDRSVMLNCSGYWQESFWVYPKKMI